MSKRHLLIYGLLILCLGVCSASFAQDITAKPLPQYEIIAPKINSNGDVIKEQHLLISLKINTPIDAVLSLTRLDEPKVVVASTEAATRLKALAAQAPIVTIVSSEAQGEIDPIVAVTKKDLLTDEDSREAIQEGFYKASLNLQSAYEVYSKAYAIALKDLDAKRLNELVQQRRLVQSNLLDLHAARQQYEKAAIIYNYVSKRYESLFRVTILNRTPIELQGILPIYNITVRDINTGKYELVVHDKTSGNRIGDRVIFVIKNSEKATEEILERVKEGITDIWKQSN